LPWNGVRYSLWEAQLNVGHVDAFGVYMGTFTTFAFCGFIRDQGQSDSSLNRLAAKKGLIQDLTKFPKEHLFHGEKQQ